MKTKITVVVDNIATNEYEGEWGLSLLVQYGDKKILVDSGASNLFASNLKKMGVDIEDIDYAVLSHGHFDHANGMPHFLDVNNKAKLFLRESTLDNCYFKKFIIKKYIGIPRCILSDYKERIQTVSGDYKLCEGVYLIPHKTENLEMVGKREMMYLRKKSGWVADDFSHEQNLVLDTDSGLIIINSCSHGGVVNIINEVKSTFPDKNIYGIIGGFHLFNKSEDEIRNVAKTLKETGVEKVWTGHCTKKRAFDIMKLELGSTIELFRVGSSMCI